MNKIVNFLVAVLKWILRFLSARKNVAVRFIFTLFFIIVLIVLVFSILVLTTLQFLILFLFVKHVDPIKSLSHMLTVYAYKVLRYMSLNENGKPFPFSSLSEELEPAEETDLTNPPRRDEDAMSMDENLAQAEKGDAGSKEEEDQEAIILDYKEDQK